MSEKNRKKRQLLNQIKLQRGCVFCGYDRHPSGLVFHHIDPLEKNFKLSQSMTRSEDSLLKETERCVVMCHNCHVVFHQLQKGDL